MIAFLIFKNAFAVYSTMILLFAGYCLLYYLLWKFGIKDFLGIKYTAQYTEDVIIFTVPLMILSCIMVLNPFAIIFIAIGAMLSITVPFIFYKLSLKLHLIY
ncbi:MAG: hypothetical protein GF364_19105 [Candidatus Lokiarchaeota archaeon]|nr:hypothetical protein [Candidatus Lokiarchaeota archaeon]